MKYDYVFREPKDIRSGDTIFHTPHDLPVVRDWIGTEPCIYLDEVQDRYPYGAYVRGILSKRPTITDDFLRRETWVAERLGCSGIDLWFVESANDPIVAGIYIIQEEAVVTMTAVFGIKRGNGDYPVHLEYLSDSEIIHALQVASATVKAAREQGYEVVP